MTNLFYIEYGCSCEKCSLIVEAEHESHAISYAQQAAVDSYYSYDCNYINPDDYPNASDEELAEIEQEEMEYDIFHSVVAFDPNNEEHIEKRFQGERPRVDDICEAAGFSPATWKKR